jgi:hypothetical protein
MIGTSAVLGHSLDEAQNQVRDALLCAASHEIDQALIDITLLRRAGFA